ncbi:hypothetical protein P9209_06245 [Prescottella defluvii]|nr:hypothetical protein P9209_06245 [Prescottella defluvii]
MQEAVGPRTSLYVDASAAPSPGDVVDAVDALGPAYFEFTAVDAAKEPEVAEQLDFLDRLPVPKIANGFFVLKDEVSLLDSRRHLDRLVDVGVAYFQVEIDSLIDPGFRISSSHRERLVELFADYPCIVSDVCTAAPLPRRSVRPVSTSTWGTDASPTTTTRPGRRPSPELSGSCARCRSNDPIRPLLFVCSTPDRSKIVAGSREYYSRRFELVGSEIDCLAESLRVATTYSRGRRAVPRTRTTRTHIHCEEFLSWVLPLQISP